VRRGGEEFILRPMMERAKSSDVSHGNPGWAVHKMESCALLESETRDRPARNPIPPGRCGGTRP
jgi:hypothetical protein